MTQSRDLAADPFCAETVIARLEEAGTTLLALPAHGCAPRLRLSMPIAVRDATESYGWQGGVVRPAVPDARRITRMDEAMGWLQLIAEDRYVLRRVVGARSLVSPVSGRHIFSWRRLGGVLGADHRAVQRWHAEGIDRIVVALRRR